MDPPQGCWEAPRMPSQLLCTGKAGVWDPLKQLALLVGAGSSLFPENKQMPDKYGRRVLAKSYSLSSSAATVVIFANHQKKLDVGLKQRNDLDT